MSYLTDGCHHNAVVHALLALKAHFAALEETSDEPGVNEARGYACEYVAWQFLNCLTERDAIEFLLHEIQPSQSPSDRGSDMERTEESGIATPSEGSALLGDRRTPSYFGTDSAHTSAMTSSGQSDEFTAQFENLSALEIAAVSNSKKFLKQRPVQKIINGLWRVSQRDCHHASHTHPFCRAI